MAGSLTLEAHEWVLRVRTPVCWSQWPCLVAGVERRGKSAGLPRGLGSVEAASPLEDEMDMDDCSRSAYGKLPTRLPRQTSRAKSVWRCLSAI